MYPVEERYYKNVKEDIHVMKGYMKNMDESLEKIANALTAMAEKVEGNSEKEMDSND